jgi:hypothetical protein
MRYTSTPPNKNDDHKGHQFLFGGESGIRTHGTLSGTPVFKTGTFNHSVISPVKLVYHANTAKKKCECQSYLLNL